MQIITFDFHNTVAHCDPWFDLEIRDLPAAVLREMSGTNGVRATEELQVELTLSYRELRKQVMASGIEVDAQTGVERVYAQAGVDASPGDIARAIQQVMWAALDQLEPVPGAIQAISRVMDAGVPVGIISSAVYHPFLEWVLEAFGLRQRLAFIATSASTGYYKSDTRIYHHAYSLASAAIELGVHVGDSPRWDVATAREAGLATALYTAPGTRRPEHPHEIVLDLLLTSMIGADEPLLDLLRERERSHGLVRP